MIKQSDLITLLEQVDENSEKVYEIIDTEVEKYSTDLEQLISNAATIIRNKDVQPTDEQLNSIILELPTTLYYVLEGLEKIGVKEDVARLKRKSKYNEAYVKSDGTINQRQIVAEDNCILEQLAEFSYQHAYKLLKSRVDVGFELLNSAKKVINSRVAGLELSKIDPSKVRRGNGSF